MSERFSMSHPFVTGQAPVLESMVDEVLQDIDHRGMTREAILT